MKWIVPQLLPNKQSTFGHSAAIRSCQLPVSGLYTASNGLSYRTKYVREHGLGRWVAYSATQKYTSTQMFLNSRVYDCLINI